MFTIFLILAQKHELQKKHKTMLMDCQSKPHNLALTKAQIEREMEVRGQLLHMILCN